MLHCSLKSYLSQKRSNQMILLASFVNSSSACMRHLHPVSRSTRSWAPWRRSATNGQDLSGSARTPASPSGVQSSPASPSHASSCAPSGTPDEPSPWPLLPFPSHLRHGVFASRCLSSRRRLRQERWGRRLLFPLTSVLEASGSSYGWTRKNVTSSASGY